MVTLGSAALNSSAFNNFPLSSKTLRNRPFTIEPAGAINSKQSLPSLPFAAVNSFWFPSHIITLWGRVLGRTLMVNCFNSLSDSLTVSFRRIFSTETSDILIFTLQGAFPGASFTLMGEKRPCPCSMVARWGPPTNASHSACSLVRLSFTEHGWLHWSRTWTVNSGNSS